MEAMVCELLARACAKLKAFDYWLLLLAIGNSLVGVGCASDVYRTATITRYRDAQSAGRARLPLCPTVSSGESTSLADRERNNICMHVAKTKRIPIANDDDQHCLAATMVWKAETSGTTSECTASFGRTRAECEARYSYSHTLTLTLVDSEEQTPVIEDHATAQSASRDLNAATAYALCAAAFFNHPQVVRNKLIAVKYDQ